MIPASTINDYGDYTSGWLKRYIDVMGQDVAPLSFHLLAGLLAMSSVIGRRAALVRPAGTLWPPTSIMLLGPSGVGKTLALQKALDLAALTMVGEEGFYAGSGGFTVAGATAEFARLQHAAGIEQIEGLHVEDEIAWVVRERTGTENMTSWLIRSQAHGDLPELTRGHGRVVIRGMTVAFGFGSTIAYMRKAISVDEFTGGFMHRFMIAHENEQRNEGIEVVPTEAEKLELIRELQRIRALAPERLGVSAPAEARLKLLRAQARKRTFDSIHLTGFWNRYSTLALKLGSLFTLSAGRTVVEVEDVEIATRLLDTKLYPVLEGVIDEMAAGTAKKRLMEVADSLRAAGPDGWELNFLFRKLDATSTRTQHEVLEALVAQKLVWKKGIKVFGKAEWAL